MKRHMTGILTMLLVLSAAACGYSDKNSGTERNMNILQTDSSHFILLLFTGMLFDPARADESRTV